MQNKDVAQEKLIDYDESWYQELSPERKKSVLTEAIQKFPTLSDHMKLHGMKGSDINFTKHYSFKMMLDVLRGN